MRHNASRVIQRIALLMLIPFVMLSTGGCQDDSSSDDATLGRPLNVIATTTLIGDVASQVAGQRANVSVLLPVGADPHSWTPTPEALARVADADILLINGIGLEDDFLQGLLDQSGTDAQVVSVSNGIRPRHFQELATSRELARVPDRLRSVTGEGRADSLLGSNPDHPHMQAEDPDPHVWMNPHNVMVWAANIQEALGKADIANGEYFAEKANWYKRKLIELDGHLQRRLEGVPPLKRRLVTDHLFLGYFADRYGFTQVGAVMPGSSTLSEPTPKDLARLEEMIRRMKIPAIFAAKGMPHDIAARVADDLHTDLRLLYTGSLSEPGGEAGNYIEYMEYNVTQIAEGLNPPRRRSTSSDDPLGMDP